MTSEFKDILIFSLFVVQSLVLLGTKQSVTRLERKLNAVIKQQGIKFPSSLSPEVQAYLIQNPRSEISAIKLHRDQNPGLGLREAKKDVEKWILDFG